MKQVNVIELIFQELQKAEKKHPSWPTDPIHAAAIVAEEAGELVQACIDFFYSGSQIDDAALEAAQCGAMAIRFLIAVDEYKVHNELPWRDSENVQNI